MNYCSLFLYFSFFSPFFFVFGRVAWMLAHFLSCPKRERGKQSAESSGKRRTERKQRNQRREWEGIYLSVLSLPRAFRRDTKRLQNQRGEHYSSPCQGAFDVPPYSMCIYMYIHTCILYICNNICVFAGIHTWMYVSVCKCFFMTPALWVCACACERCRLHDSPPSSSPEAWQPSSSSQSSPLPLSACALPPSSSSTFTLVLLAQPSSSSSSFMKTRTEQMSQHDAFLMHGARGASKAQKVHHKCEKTTLVLGEYVHAEMRESLGFQFQINLGHRNNCSPFHEEGQLWSLLLW